MVKYYRALPFKGFAFFFEVRQVNDVLVAFLELVNDFRSSLVSSRLILHGVDDENTLWD